MTYDYDRHVFRSPKLRNIIKDAVTFFEATPCHKLPPKEQFVGPGVYGLYYKGAFKAYLRMSERNSRECVLPIYVGKAVPPGTRTARVLLSNTPDLFRRLREHARSIQQVKNLRLGNFWYRFMILQNVESQLIGTVESALVRKYLPLWNACVDGFGIHDPGSGRYQQARSEWDILHPGRKWVKRLAKKAARTTEILDKITAHLK